MVQAYILLMHIKSMAYCILTLLWFLDKDITFYTIYTNCVITTPQIKTSPTCAQAS